MPLRILSVPEGASVEVDGETVGLAPVEVRLASPWWERAIAGRFETVRVEIPAAQLAAAFDTRACSMSHVVIRGPEASAPAPAPTPRPDPAVVAMTPTAPATPQDGGTELYEQWWLWALVGVVVAGAAVGVTLGVVLSQPTFELGTL